MPSRGSLPTYSASSLDLPMLHRECKSDEGALQPRQRRSTLWQSAARGESDTRLCVPPPSRWGSEHLFRNLLPPRWAQLLGRLGQAADASQAHTHTHTAHPRAPGPCTSDAVRLLSSRRGVARDAQPLPPPPCVCVETCTSPHLSSGPRNACVCVCVRVCVCVYLTSPLLRRSACSSSWLQPASGCRATRSRSRWERTITPAHRLSPPHRRPPAPRSPSPSPSPPLSWLRPPHINAQPCARLTLWHLERRRSHRLVFLQTRL